MNWLMWETVTCDDCGSLARDSDLIEFDDRDNSAGILPAPADKGILCLR